MKSRLCFALTLFCSSAALNAADAVKPAAVEKPMLKSLVIDWSKLEARATKTGERRDLFDGPTATLNNLEGHVTTLKPGESPHAPHRHVDEEMIIVKEGTLEVTINGVSQRAGVGSVFFYASNDLHGMKNVGDTNATYFVLRFVPPPKTAAPAAK